MRYRFLLIALFHFSSLFAQTERPSWLLSLDGQMTGETAYGLTVYNIDLGGSLGYFLTENILTGLEFRSEWFPGSQFYQTVPLARYYHFFANRHAIYAGGKAGYGWGWDSDIFNNKDVFRNSWVWGIRAGYLSRFSKNIALDVFLFKDARTNTIYRTDPVQSHKTQTAQFGLGLGLQIFL